MTDEYPFPPDGKVVVYEAQVSGFADRNGFPLSRE